MFNFIKDISHTIGTVVSLLGGYLIGRRKGKVEVQKVELELIIAWKKIADDLRNEVIFLRAEVKELKEEATKWIAEASRLSKEVVQLSEELHLYKTGRKKPIRE